MRTVLQLLAILTIAALLAPTARWAAAGSEVKECACPPSACTCPTHQHTSGQAQSCSMEKSASCGIGSQVNYLDSTLTTLVYLPTEHRWANPPAPWNLRQEASSTSLLPSHARIPEQPPRMTL